jgi:hypothetical protein
VDELLRVHDAARRIRMHPRRPDVVRHGGDRMHTPVVPIGGRRHLEAACGQARGPDAARPLDVLEVR